MSTAELIHEPDQDRESAKQPAKEVRDLRKSRDSVSAEVQAIFEQAYATLERQERLRRRRKNR